MVQVQDLLNNWLTSHHLTLNPSKSKYIFSNAPLQHVLSYDYLGVTISSWFSLVRIFSLRLRHMKFVGLSERLYIFHIRPILEYCSIQNLSASLSSLLESVQHFAFKSGFQKLVSFLFLRPHQIQA